VSLRPVRSAPLRAAFLTTLFFWLFHVPSTYVETRSWATTALVLGVTTVCASDRGLSAAGDQPPGPRTAVSLAKTTTLSRYLCLAAS